jgi:predicted RNA binding protein YcfA (HicA-like mRNA interferase family)
MGKTGKPKLTNCHPKQILVALNQLGDFSFWQGASHLIIKHKKTGRKFPISRSGTISKGVMNVLVKKYLMAKLGFVEEEIYKYLWC